MFRRVIRIVVSALLVVGVPAVCGCTGKEAPRNIIIVSLDTLRSDRLGCYGYHGGAGPNIDRYAFYA